MKSPTELGQRLAKQWHQPSVRLQRLLEPNAWPLTLAIGKPSARNFAENVQAIQQHMERWRGVGIGTVHWADVSYRAGATAVSLPLRWSLHGPSQWIAATDDRQVCEQFARLEFLVERVDALFHPLLIAQRGLWLNKEPEDVIATAQLAMRLSPGCAEGRPLRLFAGHGVDTKVFERNATLLSRLLDVRYEGVVSEQGLATFLDAWEDSRHWVLVAPLQSGLLPFRRLRLTTAELAETPLPGTSLIVVENEQCLHLLPELTDTMAVLGAGLDLQWLGAAHLTGKRVAYWGDMDTWGLLMLARARGHHPGLTALLMERRLFDEHCLLNAVVEPTRASEGAPPELLSQEAQFYVYLSQQAKGRLEQEFLPPAQVAQAIEAWARGEL